VQDLILRFDDVLFRYDYRAPDRDGISTHRQRAERNISSNTKFTLSLRGRSKGLQFSLPVKREAGYKG